MSRAIGDFQYKGNKKIEIGKQMVISIPDVAIHKRSSGIYLLISLFVSSDCTLIVTSSISLIIIHLCICHIWPQ